MYTETGMDTSAFMSTQLRDDGETLRRFLQLLGTDDFGLSVELVMETQSQYEDACIHIYHFTEKQGQRVMDSTQRNHSSKGSTQLAELVTNLRYRRDRLVQQKQRLLGELARGGAQPELTRPGVGRVGL